MEQTKAATALATLLASLRKSSSDSEALRATAALLDVMRIFSQISGGKLFEMLTFVADALECELDSIDFSFTSKLADQTDAAAAIKALELFVEMLAAEPAAATAELMDALIVETCEAVSLPKPAAEYPPIYSESALLRVFTPAVLDHVSGPTVLGGNLGRYRGLGLNGRCMPEQRAIVFSQTDTHVSVLLETGETFQVVATSPEIVLTHAADDYAHISPALLAHMHFMSRNPGMRSACGSFSKPVEQQVYVAPALACPALFKINRIPNYSVLVTSHLGAYGTYSHTATLYKKINGRNVVVMRIDQPRHETLAGSYIFPLPDCVIALCLVDEQLLP